jgi:hypothetical protein
MIDFKLYFNLAYSLMCIAAFYFSTEMALKEKYHPKQNVAAIILFSLLFIVLIGGRDISVGKDTINYISAFNRSGGELIMSDAKDFGFYGFSLLLKFLEFNEREFLYSMAVLYILPLAIVYCMVETNVKFLLFFSMVSLFFFQSMGVNILRQGISCSFFALSILFFQKSRPIISCFLFVVAFSFHASILIPAIFYLVSSRITDIKYPLAFFLASILLAFFNFDLNSLFKNIPVLNVIFEDRLESYILQESSTEYNTGFRFDFLVFNCFFAFIGLYVYITSKSMKNLAAFKNYLFCYLFTSGYFFLMFHVPFSDRFGVLSWVFIPFIVIQLVQKPINKQSFTPYKLTLLSIILFLIF